MANQYFTVSSIKTFAEAYRAYVKRGWKCIAKTDVLATFVKGEEKVTIIYK